MNRVRRDDIDLPASCLTAQLHEPRGQTGFQCQREKSFFYISTKNESAACGARGGCAGTGFVLCPHAAVAGSVGQAKHWACSAPDWESSRCFLSPEITVYCRGEPRSCWPRTAQLRAKVPLSHPEEAPCPAGSPHSIVPFSASQWGFSVVSG